MSLLKSGAISFKFTLLSLLLTITSKSIESRIIIFRKPLETPLLCLQQLLKLNIKLE